MPIYIILGVIALVVIFVIAIYNGLVAKRQKVNEAFSGIDVQLKLRRELVPNLVETVKGYAAHEKTTLEGVIDKLTAELIPHYGPDCPVAVVWRASWPDQRIIRATLATLKAAVPEEVERTALILVGPSLAQEGFEESRLYAGDYDRRYRPVGTHPRFPGTGR